MIHRLFPLWIITLCLSLLCDARGNELRLGGPGFTPPVIHHAPDAEDQELYAIEDLRHYLERIGGATPEVTTEPPAGKVIIHVGNVPENRALAATLAEKQLGRDGFVIEVGEDAVRILGGSKFGTAYGVYELLERMGVRWLFPGEWGEAVPSAGEMRLPVGRITDKPGFPIRRMATARADQEIGAWFRRQRHNRDGFGGHSSLVSARNHGAAHPEWFAEVNGQRRGDDLKLFKLCHANAEMTRQAGEEILALIRKRKANHEVKTHGGYPHLETDYDQISISPTDGGGFCQCAECLKMGSISDRLQIFANTLAGIVREEFPEYSVGYYGAYSEAQMPPTVKAAPGVIVYATTWTRNFMQPITSPFNTPYRSKLEAFLPQCPRMAIRDFDGLTKWWGYGPLSLVDVHAQDYSWYARHGVEGIVTEAERGWGPWGYSYYLMSKLWWHPFADVTALKRDFVTHAYAEAFEPMWSYYEKLDSVKIYPAPTVLYAMRQDLEKAARMVRREDARRRVDALRAYYYVWDVFERKNEGEAGEAEISQAIRVLRSLDPSVSPIREEQLRKEADASLSALNPEELHLFLDGVKLPQPGPPVAKWSSGDDLRLVAYPGQDAAPQSDLGINFRFGPNTILIRARAGEMLEVWQEGSSNTAYQLYGPELALIDDGVASGDGAALVRRPAPGEGIYTLVFSSGGSRPRLHVSNQRVVVKAGSASERLHPFGKMEQCFYVPKGTKEFIIVAKAWEPFTLELTGPGGETDLYPKTVQKTQTFVEHRVKVPEGMDGAIWRITLRGGKKEIFLLGVPPFLASEPSRLLVPPEGALPLH